ncbi:siderophore-iron reductase FhuF [Rhizobium bangladeshense]|uniref:Siderophore-iron reductase FhuF n=1 Tax=Rhizobium bangladeshense TaxID=1138189 RepID=A0ABS7LNG1_9HYPH|nr:siderophore-iron reductase FhuF [Rhizobium bangladeshense]MBX4867419.1 siderophore-iron reductase FhuF [Rhizobium bangladeshense]MBX4871712.1 siderophore-iron reductase FhuF [Rhizobium bangladeshense]MBX4883026.1 siderophore-iron reductase FhuF [Rhizobium bangladeshense]MBX4898662.1 siderophore-iron reductase FhuF [Rhizobium bangladeshense]MBX4905591.1 siderophore-iron reductase FhuF [Rhizobium bangladeshense]
MAVEMNGAVSRSSIADHPVARQAVGLDGLVGDGPFSYCRGKLLASPPPTGIIVLCSELGDRDIFDGIIARYGQKFPGSDRRAIVSMWTLYYFSMLTIAPSVHMFVNRIALPMEINQLSFVCNEQTGEPEAFVLSGMPEPTTDPAGELHRLMLGHAEPVIAAIAANAGVAPKLLWNNVAAYLSWILKEIAHRHEPALVEGGMTLLDDAHWPGGARNPMFGMIRTARQQCGLEFARRKVCCLRYNLPGVGGCGEACPLPDGRH